MAVAGGGAGSVLVVDDDEPLRRTPARTLLANGNEVTTAGSCSEAMSLAGPFDVGIFDIQLGDGCGVELAAAMLADGKVQRAVFYTGGAAFSQIVRAVEIGTVVSKGDGVATLLRAVRRADAAGVGQG